MQLSTSIGPQKLGSRSVVVTGGSGFIGTHLVEALSRLGDTVTNLDIEPPTLPEHRDRWVACDIREPAQLAGALLAAAPEVIYNLAAVADISADASAMAVNTGGVTNILDVLPELPGSPLLVHFSTQFVLEAGYQPAGPLDFAPYTEYGMTKARSERLLHAAGPEVAWAIVRPTTIWGPRHPTFATQAGRYLAMGIYLRPSGPGPRRHNGYVDNVVHQVVRLAELGRDQVMGTTLYVGDEGLPTSVLLDRFSMAFRGRPTRRIPTAVLRVLAEMGELSGRLGGPSPINRGRLARMTTDYPVPMQPTFDLLGRGPVSLDDGVAATVRWQRERGRSATAAAPGGRLVMIGPFPPPMGGAAKMTAGMRTAIEAAGTAVTTVDNSGPTLSHTRSIGYHLKRLARNLRGTATILAEARRSRALFLVLDGGYGIWYSLLHATAAALTLRRAFLYHVTCLYVDNDVPAARLLTRVLGRKATHIFLTAGMGERYAHRYGPIRSVVLGNAWYATPEPVGSDSGGGTATVRLGHLSNLCWEKGFFRVADAFDLLRRSGVDAELHLAGPCVDAAVRPRIDELTRAHGARVIYHGPLYAEAKAAFYRSIDVFLFPTNFSQEAAPNVLYEAAAAGVPSLSVDRGVITELLAPLRGKTCAGDADFGEFVLARLGRDPRPLAVSERKEIRELFDLAREQTCREARDILDAITRATSPAP